MLNQGMSNKGFMVCCDCGAALPGDSPHVLDGVMRPYRSKFLRTRCKHNDTINVNIGYDFITDMLVLEIALDGEQIDVNPERTSWLSRAGQSLAEALRLAACQELDIEFAELVTGYRIRQNYHGNYIDIYLYDSLSSGAGYAVGIEQSIQKLLCKTRELLSECTCDSACYNCLKHYRNQFVHGMLDRNAALDLLNWGGINLSEADNRTWVKGKYDKKEILIYPAMWKKPSEEGTVFVSDSLLKHAKPFALKTIVESL